MFSAMSTCESFCDLSSTNQRFIRMLGESITRKGLGLAERIVFERPIIGPFQPISYVPFVLLALHDDQTNFDFLLPFSLLKIFFLQPIRFMKLRNQPIKKVRPFYRGHYLRLNFM